jgi:two-component system chemotaxis response regulator CheB
MNGPKLVVIGASWGGLQALTNLLAGLRPDLGCAIVIAQHRSAKGDDGGLTHALAKVSALPVEEAEDKTPIEPGRVYLAPSDYHLMVDEGELSLSTEAEVRHSRPSIDVLFETAAEAYGSDLTAVVLTGANADGARGLAIAREHGATTVVQDPATAERREMPDAAIATGAAQHVVPLDHLAALLNDLCPAADGVSR